MAAPRNQPLRMLKYILVVPDSFYTYYLFSCIYGIYYLSTSLQGALSFFPFLLVIVLHLEK